jgi:hypothetical protein
MHTFHGGRNAHGADMRWSFVCPEGELHGFRREQGQSR